MFLICKFYKSKAFVKPCDHNYYYHSDSLADKEPGLTPTDKGAGSLVLVRYSRNDLYFDVYIYMFCNFDVYMTKEHNEKYVTL